MIARVSLKRTICWRAFSSDMWFTPKNWLSPKRMRSRVTSSPPSARQAIGLLDQVQHAVGLVGAGERVVVGEAALPDRFEEGLELGRVFLAAQVEGDGRLEAGDVARAPSLGVAVEGLAIAQEDLQLLAVGHELAPGAVHGDGRAHLAHRLVAPVRLQDA